MTNIQVFRIQNERLEKDKFAAIAEHLGVRGDIKATPEALFVQDKQRALAYALPGARFAGLLFFTDQSQGLGASVDRAPGNEEAERWTHEFLQRFQLGPRALDDQRIRTSFATRVLRTEAVQERDEGRELRRAPVKTDIISDLRVNDRYVTGPRAKVRLVFKNAKQPAWIHRSLWDRLDVFEERPLLSEDEAHRKVAERITRRGETRKTWRMNSIRLAYFAGEFCGGPDLLLRYYFVEVEFRDPKDRQMTRQGPRQLIQIRACR